MMKKIAFVAAFLLSCSWTASAMEYKESSEAKKILKKDLSLEEVRNLCYRTSKKIELYCSGNSQILKIELDVRFSDSEIGRFSTSLPRYRSSKACEQKEDGTRIWTSFDYCSELNAEDLYHLCNDAVDDYYDDLCE